MTLEWKDPPPSPKGPGSSHRWQDVAAELRSRPGEWAIVAHDAHQSMASNISTGKIAAMPRGEYQATSRSTNGDQRHCTIWARFVGPVTP